MRVLLGVLALAAGTACTAGPAPRARPATPAATTAAPAPAATSEAPAPPADDGWSFVTPSGNIACELTAEYAECSVGERSWEPPGGACRGEPARIEIWDGAVRVDCGETGAEASSYLLPYGEARTAGGLRCASARSGVTCRHARSGLGFTVSRAGYRTYP